MSTKSFLCMCIIFLHFYIKHSLGEEETEESNLRHFIEGKVFIQGDKLQGITVSTAIYVSNVFGCFFNQPNW